jgi:methionyl-tRNA synthetase
LAKGGKDTELDQVLSALARALCRLAVMTSPFIPRKAQSLWVDLGMEGEVAGSRWSIAENPTLAGRRARQPSILFPKPVKP